MILIELYKYYLYCTYIILIRRTKKYDKYYINLLYEFNLNLYILYNNFF